jgi:3-oxoadipate enol-lactonase
MAFDRLGDIVVHHDATGPKEAPVLVLANSLGTDLRVSDALLPRLGGRFRTLRYDKRGHGLTDATPEPYAMATLAADLARQLEAHGARDAIVCGLSIGCMIAQSLAGMGPDLVRGVVLLDTAHRIGTPQIWAERIAAIRAGGIAGIADAILARRFSPDFHRQRPAELAGWRNMLTRTSPEGYLGCCAAIRDADLTAAAAGLTVPTLCMVGDQDGATPPALVAEFAGIIPNARLVTVAGAGHLPCDERPRGDARLLPGDPTWLRTFSSPACGCAAACWATGTSKGP